MPPFSVVLQARARVWSPVICPDFTGAPVHLVEKHSDHDRERHRHSLHLAHLRALLQILVRFPTPTLDTAPPCFAEHILRAVVRNRRLKPRGPSPHGVGALRCYCWQRNGHAGRDIPSKALLCKLPPEEQEPERISSSRGLLRGKYSVK